MVSPWERTFSMDTIIPHGKHTSPWKTYLSHRNLLFPWQNIPLPWKTYSQNKKDYIFPQHKTPKWLICEREWIIWKRFCESLSAESNRVSISNHSPARERDCLESRAPLMSTRTRRTTLQLILRIEIDIIGMYMGWSPPHTRENGWAEPPPMTWGEAWGDRDFPLIKTIKMIKSLSATDSSEMINNSEILIFDAAVSHDSQHVYRQK